MVLHVSDEIAEAVQAAVRSGRAESADQIIGRGLATLDEPAAEAADRRLRSFLEGRLAEAVAGDFAGESLDEILATERRHRAAR